MMPDILKKVLRKWIKTGTFNYQKIRVKPSEKDGRQNQEHAGLRLF